MLSYTDKKCDECSKPMKVLTTEIKRGGGKFCSRKCYYANMRANRPRGKDSWAWKGDKVKKQALHDWVIRHLGKPKKCEHCGSTKAKKYEWANKSQDYKRELSDWIRLCTKCHYAYDRKTRFPKWKKAVQMKGWNVKTKA